MTPLSSPGNAAEAGPARASGASRPASAAAAKAAVASLSATAALEYGPDIRVNAVAPGMIHTGLTDILLTGFDWTVPHMVEKTPLGRIGTPEDIAAAVAYLAGEEARFVTGTTLVVDGGLSSSHPTARRFDIRAQ